MLRSVAVETVQGLETRNDRYFSLRAPLPAEQVRANRVVTFLTDEELRMLKAVSRRRDGTLSSTCHRIIAEYLDKQY